MILLQRYLEILKWPKFNIENIPNIKKLCCHSLILDLGKDSRAHIQNFYLVYFTTILLPLTILIPF